jgi:dTMP kinase
MTNPASPTRRGTFISFEGTEGSGKSTQMRLLVEHLRLAGHDVVENQEPGCTSIGKQIRHALLDPANAEMAPMTELLLMFASRAQAAAEVILPALQRGAIVVTDRFTDSTLAYQGCARNLGFETVWAAHRLAVGSLLPDLTLCIDMDVAAGLSRAHARNRRKLTQAPESADESRIDQQSLSFHQRVSDGYHQIAALEPQRFRLIDGSGDISAVANRIWEKVASLLRARCHNEI